MVGAQFFFLTEPRPEATAENMRKWRSENSFVTTRLLKIWECVRQTHSDLGQFSQFLNLRTTLSVQPECRPLALLSYLLYMYFSGVA